MRSRYVWFVFLVLAGWMVGLGSGRCENGGASNPDGYADVPVESRGNLRFFVDSSGFRGPTGWTRQEFYILLDAAQLEFAPGESAGEVSLTVTVADTAGAEVAVQSWTRRMSIPYPDVIMAEQAPFRDRVGFDLMPGPYRATVVVEDAGGKSRGVCELGFMARNFEQAGLIFSDLLLALDAERVDDEDRFYKRGWKITPNVNRHFVSGRPVSVYFELYNLPTDADQESFILGYSLVDSAGAVVRRFPARRAIKPGESCATVEVLGTDKLDPGGYQVQVEAYDGGSREHIFMRRRVFLASAEQIELTTQVERSLLRYYSHLLYVADEKTMKAYRELKDWPSKARFLRAFWRSQDPTPGTPENERLMDHIMRMHYADTHFSAGHRVLGADTDKGRVYVMYGPPAEIDYHTSAAGQKPYEVWYYERQGRYGFVFRDRRGIGVYELVHSTYPGELYNPYWQNEL